MSGNYSFYHGHVWTDYSNGMHVLTLKTPAAGALQATIPVWISLVGGGSWIFIKRMWYHGHFRRNQLKNLPSNLFDRQRQVLLRNSAGDLGTLWEAKDLWWTWRKMPVTSRRPLSRILPLLLTVLIFWSFWQVASIISFYIWQTKVPDVGLIRSQNCGYLLLNSSTDNLAFRSVGLSQTILAETWVSQCYGNSSTDSGACNLYPTQSIDFTNKTDVPCPFTSPDICISANSTPYQMDSGPINSHTDLGINAPKKDRITYQKITTCSPIHGTPFAKIVNANETDEADLYPPDTVLQRYFLGPIHGFNETWTFEYNTWAPLDGFGYQISSFSYTPGLGGELDLEGWLPNSILWNRQDADLSLFVLTANHVIYSFPSYDPFYMATESYVPSVGPSKKTYWVPTYYVNLLGCIDQHRICNPSRDKGTGCTTLLAWSQLIDAMFTIGLNAAQVATAERIVANLVMTTTVNSVNGRNAAALLASQTVSELEQTKSLPSDQWRLEVENWFSVSLAKLQRGVIDYAGGPSDASLTAFAKQPSDPELAKMCDSQLVKLPSPDYANFNFDAIIGVLVAGIFLAILTFFFEDIFDIILKWKGNTAGQKQWTFDGPYQLQRLAYRGHGVGDWVDEEEEIPMTSASLPLLASSIGPQQNVAASLGHSAATANTSTSPLINPGRPSAASSLSRPPLQGAQSAASLASGQRPPSSVPSLPNPPAVISGVQSPSANSNNSSLPPAGPPSAQIIGGQATTAPSGSGSGSGSGSSNPVQGAVAANATPNTTTTHPSVP